MECSGTIVHFDISDVFEINMFEIAELACIMFECVWEVVDASVSNIHGPVVHNQQSL